nr:YccF domain-containing protein [Schwartzia sp. (in: firmicutes)]
MAFVGNLLWLVFGGGIFLGLAGLFFGLVWCVTIVGIPIGIGCFRVAGFAFCPFGKELVPAEWVGEKRIVGTGVMNFLWCILSGLWLAIGHILVGLFDCVTIIGIPFGLANFKLAGASFAPLGKRTVSKAVAAEARVHFAKTELDKRFSRRI